MQLKALETDKHSVVGVWDATNERTEIEAFLESVDAQYKASAAGFRPLFERYAKEGRQGLTDVQFHEANKAEKIWEFIKGNLRIYCFMDMDAGNNLVLLSHGIIKKRQKAQPCDINKVIRLRDEYINAKKSGTLERI